MSDKLTPYLGVALVASIVGAIILSGLGKPDAPAWTTAGMLTAGLLGVNVPTPGFNRKKEG